MFFLRLIMFHGRKSAVRLKDGPKILMPGQEQPERETKWNNKLPSGFEIARSMPVRRKNITF